MTLSREDLASVADELGAALDDRYGEVAFKPRFNVAPSDAHPLLMLRAAPGSRRRTIVPAVWGLPAAAGRPTLINARAETATWRASFRDAFVSRRCVVVTDGFLEWKRQGDRRRPVWLHRTDGRLLLLAGLYEDTDPRRFVVLTTAPNALVATIHDRMPAVLPTEREVERWLDRADPSLLRPAPDGLLAATAVSTRVNSVRHDDPACLAPADDEAAGDAQLTLF